MIPNFCFGFRSRACKFFIIIFIFLGRMVVVEATNGNLKRIALLSNNSTLRFYQGIGKNLKRELGTRDRDLITSRGSTSKLAIGFELYLEAR